MSSAKPSRAAFAALLAAAGFASTVKAATLNWVNLGVGNWTDGTNWDMGVAPTSVTNDRALINNGGTAVIDSTQNATAGSITLGVAGTQVGNIQMTGGTLVNSNTDLRIGGDAATTAGTGTFTQSGGAITWNFGNMNLGFGSAGANGTYTLSGGSFQLNSTNSIVAVANRGTAVINQSGGTFYVKSGANTLTGLLNIGRNVVNGTAAGTVNLSGGTMAVAQIRYGNATNSAGSINTFNLQGTGTLIADSITIFANHGGTDTFNFTGGNLTANTIGLSLTNNGGTLRPGAHNFASNPADINAIVVNPIGTTVFGNNNYVQAALGTYAVDIGGIGSNDVIDAGAGSNTGSITLAGSINVNLLNGFDPAPGSTFDIATADTLTSAALVNGTTPSGNLFTPSIVTGGDGRQVLRLTVTAVPEPGSLVLLAGAGFSLAYRRPRRRQRPSGPGPALPSSW